MYYLRCRVDEHHTSDEDIDVSIIEGADFS
jgi:hypothetical protein